MEARSDEIVTRHDNWSERYRESRFGPVYFYLINSTNEPWEKHFSDMFNDWSIETYDTQSRLIDRGVHLAG